MENLKCTKCKKEIELRNDAVLKDFTGEVKNDFWRQCMTHHSKMLFCYDCNQVLENTLKILSEFFGGVGNKISAIFDDFDNVEIRINRKDLK